MEKEKEDPTEWIQIIQKIAMGALKYFEFSHSRLKDYKFSYDHMLRLKGNTIVYLLYTLVRMKSILRRAGQFEEPSSMSPDVYPLMFKLLEFRLVCQRLPKELDFHSLCSYLYSFCSLINKYYEKTRCLEFDKEGKVTIRHLARLKITAEMVSFFEFCLKLMGIEHLDRI